MSAFSTRPITAALAGTASILLLGAPAFAAPPSHGACAKPGILSVSGHGESRVAPDQVMISLGVTTQAETAAEAMRSNSERQQAVLDTLGEAGVNQDDIQTSGLSLNPLMNYPENGDAPSIDGYMAQNLLTVRVTEINRAGEVLDSIVTAGANEMQGIRFIREDSQATEDEALQMAVEDATHRASVMAEAAGVELGPIIRIGEPKNDAVPPGPVMMRAMGAEADAKSIPVEGGEVAFTADVDVSFALPGAGCDMPGKGDKPMEPKPMPTEATDPAGDAATAPDLPDASEADRQVQSETAPEGSADQGAEDEATPDSETTLNVAPSADSGEEADAAEDIEAAPSN
ncbi:SIMPL domain-containing protein [Paracoccus albus]|uniref:SIMPL domain-containing protein n=1 Tax=Paracoccus albus TaxID=3017784 RepID=UPI0022F0EAAF|nr:SIMPL domain-containing protein [Paracoccus albus]WBU60967.1 SIMPL domain-containing protein [Paracoccus albus]